MRTSCLDERIGREDRRIECLLKRTLYSYLEYLNLGKKLMLRFCVSILKGLFGSFART